MKRFAVTALCLFALAACDKPAETKTDDPSKNPTTTTGAAATATATTATGTPTVAQPTTVTINDSDVATPADFEEKAEQSITVKNYKAELATMETELAKD